MWFKSPSEREHLRFANLILIAKTEKSFDAKFLIKNQWIEEESEEKTQTTQKCDSLMANEW